MKKNLFFMFATICAIFAGTTAFAGGIGGTSAVVNFTTIFGDKVGQSYATNYGWQSIQAVNPNRAVAMGTSTPNRFNNSTIQVTVQPGDNPVIGCGTCSERMEMLQMFPTSGGGQANDIIQTNYHTTEYYAISVYLPDTWVDPTTSPNHWAIFAQLHPPDTDSGASPSVDLEGAVIPGHYVLQTLGGLYPSGLSLQQHDLGPYVFDQWVDFVWRVTWSDDTNGQITAWTRINKTGTLQQLTTAGAPIPIWNGATLYSQPLGTVQRSYWKSGLYRSDSAFTSVLYEGPFCRANTFAAAAKCAFGQYP